jgi:hypothetical protein
MGKYSKSWCVLMLLALSVCSITALAKPLISGHLSYVPQNMGAGGYTAMNNVGNWRIDFLPSGETVLHPLEMQKKYRIGIKLQNVNQQHFSKPEKSSHDGNRITYHWNNSVTEWWVNSAEGIEQWFKLDRPGDAHSNRENNNQQTGSLELKLALLTDLAVSQQGNRLLFTSPDAESVSYQKLVAWDSTGRVLPSRMTLSEHTVSLVIDDRDAMYPVTVDPSFEGEAHIEGGSFVVAVSGNTMVVGWPFKDRPPYYDLTSGNYYSAEDSGLVQVYVRSGVQPVREWTLQQTFEPVLSATENLGLLFGFRVAIDGDVMAIGNRIFTRNAGTWVERTRLLPIGGGTLGLTDYVAISGGTIVIGDGYVFNRVGNTFSWSNQTQLIPGTTGGAAVTGPLAISGNTIIIGHETEDGDASSTQASPNTKAPDAGAAYVFSGSGSLWSQQAYLKAGNAEAGDKFGHSVAISGDSIIVGATDKAGFGGSLREGAAYIFTRTGNTWNQQAYLKSSDSSDFQQYEGDEFGSSVDIDGDTAVVGARNEDSRGYSGGDANNESTDAGAAYVFSRTGSNWSQITYLKEGPVDGLPDSNGSPESYEHFGHSVSIDGEIIAVSTAEPAGLDVPNAYTTEAVTVFIKRYIITVNVSGLPSGGSLRLLNSHTGDDVLVDGNQVVTLPTYLANGRNYNVTVSNTPTNPNYTCIVTGGTGYIQGADIDIAVVCSIDMHTVSGTISGLTGSGLVLQNNGAQSVNVNPLENEFHFSAQPDGSAYLVSVASHPNGQLCTVTGGYGNINASNVTDVAVVCHQNAWAIKGDISGLLTSLVLRNLDTGENIPLTNSDGSFNFQSQAEGSHYHIAVGFPGPVNPSQSCSITNSQGVIQSDVFLEITCTVDSFRVKARVWNMSQDMLGNLTPFTGLVVQNNGGDDLIVNNASVFYSDHYFTPQPDLSAYSVTVLNQPDGFLCSTTDEVDSSSGSFSGRDVTVNVRCFLAYTVTPVVTGAGSISPATPQTVEKLSTTDFILTPDNGYALNSVTGCNGTLNGNTYTTGLVVQDCSVNAVFAPIVTSCTTQDIVVGPGASYSSSDALHLKTQGNLTTSGSVSLASGSVIAYTANSYISLNAGFVAMAGSEFSATVRTVDCSLEQ